MRIFMFASRYPIPYKPYYDNQFADLVRRGHDLTIFSRGAIDPDTINEKVRRYNLDERTRHFPAYLSNVPEVLASLLSGGLLRPLSLLEAGHRIWKEREDGSVKRALRDLARMLAVNVDDPDLCFVHGLGTAVGFGWLPQAFPEASTAMFYHGGEVPSVPDVSDRVASKTFDSFDIVFTNTRFSAHQAEERGCDPGKIRVLPVGFDIEEFSPPPEHGLDGGKPLRLLSAGRMSEEKGYDYALEALRILRKRGFSDFKYRLAGEGYYTSELKEHVEDYELGQHVDFLGRLSTHEVMEAMRRTDVLVLPSVELGNWAETQAAAVQEAMLLRCLTVTTRIGGVPESIPECMQPFCVPQEDPEALAAAIARIGDMNLGQRRQLADQCRSFVVENYDIRKLNERMLNALNLNPALRAP